MATMVTMVTSTRPATKKGIGSGTKFSGGNGKKPGSNGWKGGDGGNKFSPGKYKVTMWIILASIVMMFAALSSTYVVLASNEQRQPVTMPRMFFLSTAIILTSSWAFTRAKRALVSDQLKTYRKWLSLTLVLGFAFIASQLAGWRELASEGVYFTGQPHSSFFYLFTGLHGAHIFGGITLLLFLFLRARSAKLATDTEKSQTWTSVIGLYWHAMDGIWIWLFLLLLILK
jgi:cytochrome c oxidase subunit 3